jgi:hypothetical protein
LSNGTYSYIHMYINAVAKNVMLCLQHDFYNTVFKITHKLYIAWGSAHKEKFWVRAWNRRILEIERGSTSLHSLENSLWKRLWTCHKIDCVMVVVVVMMVMIVCWHKWLIQSSWLQISSSVSQYSLQYSCCPIGQPQGQKLNKLYTVMW